MIRLYIILILLTSLFTNSKATSIFTYRSPESDKDLRYDYDNALLKLALDKTKEKYGPYKMVPSPVMNFLRAAFQGQKNDLPNFFYKNSADPKLMEKLSYIPFPVDLGIVGYRVSFVSPKSKESVSMAKNLNDLKKFIYGQGRGWQDVQILKASGFKVSDQSADYELLFKMVANNRFDLFPRGANELFNEWNAYKNINGLDYDQSFAIYYPLPRFYYTNKRNKDGIKRIKEGLEISYNDGSLKELWRKYYGKSIEFAKLNNRNIFYLKNPLLKSINNSYEKYLWKPEKDK